MLTDFNFQDLLPGSIAGDTTIDAAATVLNRELQAVSGLLDKVQIYHRLDELSGDALNLLAWQFNVDFFDLDLPEDQKRDNICNSIAWHKKKGTPWAVETALGNAGYGAQVITYRQFRELMEAQDPPEIDGTWQMGAVRMAVPSHLTGLPWLSHWAEFCVKMDLAALVRSGWEKEVRQIVDVAKNTRSWPLFYYYLDMITRHPGAAIESDGQLVKSTRCRALPCSPQLNGSWRLGRAEEKISLDGSWALDGFFRVGQVLNPAVMQEQLRDCRIITDAAVSGTSQVPAGFPEINTVPDFNLEVIPDQSPFCLDGVDQIGVRQVEACPGRLGYSWRLDGSIPLAVDRKLSGAWRLDGLWALNESWIPSTVNGRYRLDGQWHIGPETPESVTWPQARGKALSMGCECGVKIDNAVTASAQGSSFAVALVGTPDQVAGQSFISLALKPLPEDLALDGTWALDGCMTMGNSLTLGSARRLDGSWPLDIERSALIVREGEYKLDGTWVLGQILPETRIWPRVKG